jgi:uncharacterized protein (TIGR00255 family)
MKSMTGYGKAALCVEDIEFKTEIKTINNRYLDINCKMPRLLYALEDDVRKAISAQIKRGRIDIYINFSDNRKKDVNINVNLDLARGYLKAAETLSDELNISNDLTVKRLLEIPDIVRAQEGDTDTELYRNILLQCLSLAVEQLNIMRGTEGGTIKKDIVQKIALMYELTHKIEQRAPIMHKENSHKLKQRITEALENVDYDEARLLNEIAFYVDKYNIDEEILRLKSHLGQFETIINDKDASGRKIDFLIQELNREANTICSKSADTQITNCALELKTEIEKIREQVQNIE